MSFAFKFRAGLLVFVSLLPIVGWAQEKNERTQYYQKAFTLPQMAARAKVVPQWLPDRSGFWFAKKVEGSTNSWEFLKVTPGGISPLFDQERLRTSFTKANKTKLGKRGVPFRTFKFVAEGKAITFRWDSDTWKLELDSYELGKWEVEKKDRWSKPRSLRPGFTSGAAALVEVASPDEKWFLGDDETNLYLRESGAKEKKTLTEGEKDFVWTVGGAKWSPDSRFIAVLRADTRKCDRIPVIDWTSDPVEKVKEFPYSKAGRPMARTELYVIDAETRKNRKLDGTGREDHYYHLAGWIDGEIWFHRMDRRYKKLELVAANPATGKSRVVLTEQSDTFVGALYYHVAKENYLFPNAGDDQFLWISERDGWRHLYLYEKQSGKLIKRLTEGEWEVERVLTVNTKDDWVSFLGHAEKNPYETHVYRVNLDGSGFKKLTAGAGQHSANWSPDHSGFVDTWSSAREPMRTEFRDADGKLLHVVKQADMDKLVEKGWREPEQFICKAADGETDLYGVLYKPYDFDPKRKYPVLDYIYNGPFTKWVPRSMDDPRAGMCQAMAQMGFVVIVVDGRGTIGRGKSFQDVVYRNWGNHEIPDHAATLQQLAAKRPWMDTSRVGIFGGSWGGYMTLRAMLTHPDVYHAGVATAAVADLNDHASVPIEGYMGLPEDHPKEYKNASNLRLAKNLKGKLLLIHGTADVNATYSACMKMTKALIDAGKQHDLVVLPNAPHWAQGKNAAYLQQATVNHFTRHLKPEKIVPVVEKTEQ